MTEHRIVTGWRYRDRPTAFWTRCSCGWSNKAPTAVIREANAERHYVQNKGPHECINPYCTLDPCPQDGCPEHMEHFKDRPAFNIDAEPRNRDWLKREEA